MPCTKGHVSDVNDALEIMFMNYELTSTQAIKAFHSFGVDN